MKIQLTLSVLVLAGCASGTDSNSSSMEAPDSSPYMTSTSTSGFDNQITTQFVPNQDNPIILEPESERSAVAISLERISVRDGRVVDVQVKREDARGMLTMLVTTAEEEYPFSTLGAVESLSAKGKGYSSQLFRMDCTKLVKYANTKDQEYELRITATNGFTDYVLTKEAKQMFKAASEVCEQ